jgi:hypothetical protein
MFWASCCDTNWWALVALGSVQAASVSSGRHELKAGRTLLAGPFFLLKLPRFLRVNDPAWPNQTRILTATVTGSAKSAPPS